MSFYLEAYKIRFLAEQKSELRRQAGVTGASRPAGEFHLEEVRPTCPRSAAPALASGHGLATLVTLATTAAVTVMTVAQAASMSPLPAT